MSGGQDLALAAAALAPPDLDSLRAAVTAFRGTAVVNPSPVPPTEDAPPWYDLSQADHRRALLRRLNAWGCRIRYPRPGEPDLFDTGTAAWAARWGDALPGPRARLAQLTDDQIASLGGCYADLVATRVGPPERPRTLGPTAASKMLHMLRPRALMPWDEAIAQRLHGARDAAAYMAHQRLGRTWIRRLLADTGVDEESLAWTLGCPGRPLAKVLDDYCYIRFTRGDSL